MVRSKIIKTIREDVKTYNRSRMELKNVVELLLASKKVLKDTQCLYWQCKQIRDNKYFIQLYNDAKDSYSKAKKRYEVISLKCKHYKDSIKDSNRRLAIAEGKYNG